MKPVPLTPDGWPEFCPACGRPMRFQPSHTIESDIQCPRCYSQISFVRLQGAVQSYVAARPSQEERAELERYELSRIFPEEVARENYVCPMGATDNSVFVASSDPENDELRNKLAFIVNRDVYLFHAEREMIAG